jgi:hypothetical protein
MMQQQLHLQLSAAAAPAAGAIVSRVLQPSIQHSTAAASARQNFVHSPTRCSTAHIRADISNLQAKDVDSIVPTA